MIEVLRKIPGCGKYLFLNNTCNQLLAEVCFFTAEFIGCIRNLIGISDFSNSYFLEHHFPKLSWFILTDVFWGDQLPKLLILAFLRQETRLVSINFNIDLFDNFLENLIIDIGKELVQLWEVNMIFIFLQKPDDICLSPSLNKMLVSSALRIIDLHVSLRLYLAH